ncbi:hypothetical protein GCM10023322_38320 [Rugosimonospora acidiphila]|uniref:Uncharacterized protein n=1 Tax=Rugosimonospora acidiphila TaxID=556531 RepID=A0ABP9RVV4_9ACTN
MDDPTALLTEPGEPDDSVSNGFANPADLFNYVSPSAWINSAIESLTGFDVFGYFTDWVGGDWAAIWKFGDAMGNLAECMQQIGINIQQGMLQLDNRWDGNADDAAFGYFSTLASAASGQQIALRDSREAYHKAAQGAWHLSNQLGNILQALADKAILAGITAAAGTVLAETGIGAVAGYAAATLIVADMVKLINSASTIINAAITVIVGIAGAGMDLGYKGGNLSAINLPNVAYVAPGA